MLHTPIHAASEVDPDVVQAIDDFREIGARVRRMSGDAVRHEVGSRERKRIEDTIRMDVEALDLRASRIGGGWTGHALLIAIQTDIDFRARRVAHPRNATPRFHLDRVTQAMAREQAAKAGFEAATLELEAATSERAAAEHAARHFENRRAGK